MSAAQQSSSTSIDVLAVVNRASGKQDALTVRELLRGRFGQVVEVPSSDGINLVQAIRDFETRARGESTLIVSAGGDGTIHHVANAAVDAQARSPIAVLPCGTGNDLARTLGMPLDLEPAVEALTAMRRFAWDAIRVHLDHGQSSRLIMNLAVAGNGPKVSQSVSSEAKQRWGPLAYLAAGLKVLGDLEIYQLQMAFDDGPPEPLELVNILVANGRSVGGGIEVNPAGNPCDGQFEVIGVRGGGFIDWGALAANFVLSDYLASAQVVFRRARTLWLEQGEPLDFSLDGELVTARHFEFEILPAALAVIVGPAFQPRAPSDTAGSNVSIESQDPARAPSTGLPNSPSVPGTG